MDDSKLRFGVGVLVIAAIGIGVILTFLFGAFPALLNREYTLNVYFPSAEGINTNTPVLRDGVKIGRVSDIQLQDEGGVLLMLAMSAEHTMSHHYIPQIGIGSLITGDSKLEFRKAEPRELKVLFESDQDMIERSYSDGEYFAYGQKLDDPFSLLFGMEDELRTTFKSIRGAGDAVQNIGDSIQGLVQDVRGVIGLENTPPAYPNQTSWPANPTGHAKRTGHQLASWQPMRTHPYMQNSLGMIPAPDWVKAPSAAPQVQLAVAVGEAHSKGLIAQTAAYQNQGGFRPPTGAAPGNKVTLIDLQNEAIQTLQELQGAIRDARSILGNEQVRQGINDTVTRLPGVLDEATATLKTTQRTFDSFAEVGEQFEQVGDVAEAALTELKDTAGDTLQSFQATAQNIEAITEPISQRSGELVEAVLRSLANVDNALFQIDTFGETLNNSDGTLKRIMEDDELYYEFRRTLENIEAATARVRPILDDVRVFTDKIARDPRQLGVRGALGKRPTGAGLK
ncbi:MlaD protein [Neorhodopirellula lusitana]|uniref:MlaD protein n=1 Tax=Neorhodopirellula lusitana TaxID=445327 RepID=A0ABY1PX20_9BACT|nr:MlaD family protein [Neorhodopirellula lusitana]SMP50742.1 MlaD protein [Neorhodopirellula lusitana]